MAKVAPLASVGVDRRTGKVLTGFDHCLQSLGVIFTTHFGEIVLRRWFGSAIPALLGRNMDPPTMLRFWTAICVAIDLWEPRYRVTKITLLEDQNSPKAMRQSKLSFAIEGVYMPRGHLGDFTPEGPRRLFIRGGQVSVA